jgi:hypothetical protein
LNYGVDSHKKSIDLIGGIGLGINDKIALGSNVSWSIPIGGNFDSVILLIIPTYAKVSFIFRRGYAPQRSQEILKSYD